MWELADNASLRFVRDAVRYRRADTIDLVIQDEGRIDADLSLGFMFGSLFGLHFIEQSSRARWQLSFRSHCAQERAMMIAT